MNRAAGSESFPPLLCDDELDKPAGMEREMRSILFQNSVLRVRF